MRHALGHFATGVTIVTGFAEDREPVGFACQSFASVSLHPPLVLFCADHRGRSWPRMRDQGRFTVNVLEHQQRDLIGRFGSSGGARFDGLDWTASAQGGPSLPGVLMRVHCAVEQVHVAGDHDVVVGRVLDLEDGASGRPMLFYRGRFTVSERRTSSGAEEIVDEGVEPMDDYWG
jgi:flavin reductase (DIM6/NTAB) family NADH-FMN oxidoreductase RutF